MFYIHPWEIDPGSAAAAGVARRRGCGITAASTTTLDRLERLVDDFRVRYRSRPIAGGDAAPRRRPCAARWAHAEVSCACRWPTPARPRRVGRVRRRARRRGRLSRVGLAARVRQRVRPRAGLPDRRAAAAHVAGVLPLVQIKSLLFGNTLTSLPFLNYGGVMADAADVGRGAGRGGARARRARGAAATSSCATSRAQFPDLPCKQHKVSMRLAARRRASGTASIARSATRFARREKSGLIVERGGAELVGDFYTVFARNMRDLGTPVYSRRLVRGSAARVSRTHRSSTSCA